MASHCFQGKIPILDVAHKAVRRSDLCSSLQPHSAPATLGFIKFLSQAKPPSFPWESLHPGMASQKYVLSRVLKNRQEISRQKVMGAGEGGRIPVRGI